MPENSDLEKQIEADSWVSTGWWSPKMGKKSLITGVFVGFCVWLVLEIGLLKASQKWIWDPCFPLDLIGFIVVLTIVSYFALLAGAKRKLVIEKWCDDHGWSFKGNYVSLKEIGFREGHQTPGALMHRSDQTSNHMWKKIDDRIVLMGGVEVWDGQEDRNGRITYTAAFLMMEIDTPAPQIIVHNHSLTYKTVHHETKLERVEFELNDFNKRWTVLSDNPRGAFDIMDQSTIEFLMQCDDNLFIEFHEGLLAICKLGGTLIDDRVEAARFAEAFSRAVPDDLVKPISIL